MNNAILTIVTILLLIVCIAFGRYLDSIDGLHLVMIAILFIFYWTIIFGYFYPSANQICAENNIKYELVETISQYTGADIKEVAIFFKYINNNDMRDYEAIHAFDDSLSKDDIEAILQVTARKIQQRDS